MEPAQDYRILNLARITAIMCLLGVFLPVLIPGRGGDFELMFPNFSVLGLPAPFMVKLLLIIPILSGILGFISMGQEANRSRVILWGIAGFLPFLLGLIANADAMGGLMGMGGRRGPMGGFSQFFTGGGAASFIGSTGLMLLIGGAIAGIVRNKHQLPATIAGIGGGMLALVFILPMGSMPGGGSMIPIALPFQVLSANALYGLFMLLLFGLVIGASVLGIIWAVRSKDGVNHGWQIRNLLLGALTAVIIFIVFLILIEGSRGGGQAVFLILVTSMFLMAKLIAFAGAMLFAKVMFIVELVAYDNSILNEYIGGNQQPPSPPAGGGGIPISYPDSSAPSTPPPPPPPAAPPTGDSGQGGDGGIDLNK